MKLFKKWSGTVPGVLLLALALVAFPSINRADGTNSVVTTSPATKPVPYPLDICIISGDKLEGDMGKPIEFVYTNKSVNQEIKFCCPDCKAQFLKNPDKYLKLIKAKAAAKTAKS